MLESSWEELPQCGGVRGEGGSFFPWPEKEEGGGWEPSHPHLSHICVCKVDLNE